MAYYTFNPNTETLHSFFKNFLEKEQAKLDDILVELRIGVEQDVLAELKEGLTDIIITSKRVYSNSPFEDKFLEKFYILCNKHQCNMLRIAYPHIMYDANVVDYYMNPFKYMNIRTPFLEVA